MTGRPIIRAAEPRDYRAIGDLLDARFGAVPREQRETLWNWRSVSNPARRDSIPPFLVAERDDEIVGAHGLIPVRMSLCGQTVWAAYACDFAVSDAVRNVGMKLKLAAMAKDLCDVAVSTSANSAAKKITLALRGQTIPDAGYRYIVPLRPDAFVSGGLARWGAQAPAWAFRGLIRARSRLLGNRSRVVAVTRAGPAVDEFWEELSASSGSLVAIRDSSYLNWRYFDYPFADTVAFAVEREGRIAALAMAQIGRDQQGHRACVLGELLFRKGEEASARGLVDRVSVAAMDRGAHYVYGHFSAKPTAALLLSRGFIRRGESDGGFTVKVNLGSGAEALATPYVTAGDGDCAFF